MEFKPGMICKTRDGREVEILKLSEGSVAVMDTQTTALAWWTEEAIIPPKRTREVTVYVNVLKHEGIEWSATHDSYTVAKYSTTILDPRIEVLAVAVPVTFTVEY